MTHSLWPRFIDAVGELDAEAIDHIAFDALTGSTTNTVIDDLIRPALSWIGDQWAEGRWTVDREHRATQILTGLISRLPIVETSDPKRSAVVIPAEGEWHTAAAMMAAHALRTEGFGVIELDGPIAAGQLLPMLHQNGPRLVAISCVMTAHLAGARRLAAVVRDAGIPVIAGGRAITPTRGTHVGAHSSAHSTSAIAQAVAKAPLVSDPLPPLQHRGAKAYEWLDLHLADLAAELADEAETADLAVDGVWMLRNLKAALMCDEPDLLVAHVAWQRSRESLGGPSTDRLLELTRRITIPAPNPTHRFLATAASA